MWTLVLLLASSLSFAQAIDVYTAAQLEEAINRNDTHIVVREHLDLRSPIIEGTCHSLCEPATITAFTISFKTKSIRGNCSQASLADFQQQIAPPLAPELGPVQPGHCLLLTDKVLFTVWGGGPQPPPQLWLDGLFIRTHRLPNNQKSPTFMLSVSVATVWLSNVTIQGDAGPTSAIFSTTAAKIRVSDSSFLDLNNEIGTVALAADNSTLDLERCRVLRSVTRSVGVITLGTTRTTNAASMAVLRNVSFSGVVPTGQPRLSVALRSAGTFFTDTAELVYNLDSSEPLASEPLAAAPLDEGVFAAGPEPGSAFDVLWRDALGLPPALPQLPPPPLQLAAPAAAPSTPLPLPAARPPGGGFGPGEQPRPAQLRAPPPAPPADGGRGGVSEGVILAVAGGVSAVVVALAALVVCCLVRTRRDRRKRSADIKPAAVATGGAVLPPHSAHAPPHSPARPPTSAPSSADPAGYRTEHSMAGTTETTIVGHRFDPAVWPGGGFDPAVSSGAPSGTGSIPAASKGAAALRLADGAAAGSEDEAAWGIAAQSTGAAEGSSAPTQAPATVTEYARGAIAQLPAGLGCGEPGSSVDLLEDALDEVAERKLKFMGRYHLGSNVERRSGGQGVVQFARIDNSADQVAIKFYSHHEAFEREAELYENPAFKELMPATLAIEGNSGGRERLRGYAFPPCIIIEKGQSLNEWAHANRCDFVTVFQALSHSVRALGALHNMGYAHRDIKPGNVLRRPKQHDWTLIDFGCAARIGTPTKVSFSLVYAAPETVRAVEAKERTVTADAAVDIWAIGVIAFELLTGERTFPFAAPRADVLAAIAGRSPLPWEDGAPRAAALRARMRGLKRTVLQCLRRDPAERPTAAELLASWDHLFDSIQTFSVDALPSDGSGMSGRTGAAATAASAGTTGSAGLAPQEPAAPAAAPAPML